MTTRRKLLIAGAGMAALAGCRDTAPAAAPAASSVDPPDVLLAESEQGLLRLSPTGAQQLGAAALSTGGAHLYRVRDNGVARVDPVSGTPAAPTAVEAGWLPLTVSTDGLQCVLGRTPLAARPTPRATSSLLVVTGADQRRYDLPGVVEPDAFTADGSGLFVLDWQPANAPEHYRVRLLDLRTGRLQPLFTRDKKPVAPGAEEQMRGEVRQATLSADSQLLFTLYTHQPGHAHTRDLVSGRPGNAHAFVHVLHLSAGWAFCLDLPHPFGEGPAAGHALAADGQDLVVYDAATGKIAYADPVELTIRRVAAAPTGTGAAALALDGGRALAGVGDRLAVLDRASDTVTARWTLPTALRGLALSRDGKRAYAGGSGEVVWLDATSGARQGRTAVPGLTALRYVS